MQHDPEGFSTARFPSAVHGTWSALDRERRKWKGRQNPGSARALEEVEPLC